MENKIKNVVETEQNKENDPVEKRVVCGEDTPYRFSTPINQREHYVAGSGRICQRCHYEIHIKKSR